MRFLNKDKLGDAKSKGLRIPVPVAKDRKADALEKLPALLRALADAVSRQPAPRVENKVNVSPTPVNFKPEVKPEIRVETSTAKPVSWVFEIDRGRYGHINRVIAKPMMDK